MQVCGIYPKKKANERLLDLGCGNGSFLLRARCAGWDVVGLDPDPKAVEVACSQGLDVRLGDLGTLDPSIEQFDVITLAHVIEHVHHPAKVLEACYRLLRTGGFLWIRVFLLFNTPGEWDLKKYPNPQCDLVWLNPIPIEEDIGNAYLTYFAHRISEYKNIARGKNGYRRASGQ